MREDSAAAMVKTVGEKTIDYDKVETLEDVKAILKACRLTFFDDGSEQFAPVRHLYVGADDDAGEG